MELIREIPDTALAGAFDGEPMVQSFRVGGRGPRLDHDRRGADSVPGFGRPWVAGAARRACVSAMGARAFNRALRAGLAAARRRAGEALPLAA